MIAMTTTYFPGVAFGRLAGNNPLLHPHLKQL